MIWVGLKISMEETLIQFCQLTYSVSFLIFGMEMRMLLGMLLKESRKDGYQ